MSSDRGTGDPTRMRDQAALTRSSGRIWIITAGIFAVISLAVLVPMAVMGLPPVPLPGVAAGAVVVLYLAMLVVRARIVDLRPRLAMLAVLFIAMAAVALAAVLVVGFAAAVQTV